MGDGRCKTFVCLAHQTCPRNRTLTIKASREKVRHIVYTENEDGSFGVHSNKDGKVHKVARHFTPEVRARWIHLQGNKHLRPSICNIKFLEACFIPELSQLQQPPQLPKPPHVDASGVLAIAHALSLITGLDEPCECPQCFPFLWKDSRININLFEESFDLLALICVQEQA